LSLNLILTEEEVVFGIAFLGDGEKVHVGRRLGSMRTGGPFRREENFLAFGTIEFGKYLKLLKSLTHWRGDLVRDARMCRSVQGVCVWMYNGKMDIECGLRVYVCEAGI